MAKIILNGVNYSDTGTSGVSGVKGNAEGTYRKGNVNITPANIGLGNVGNYKAVSTISWQGLSETEKTSARNNINAATADIYDDISIKMERSPVYSIGDWSNSLGYNTVASNFCSIAIGNGIRATGEMAVALNYETRASNHSSCAVGKWNKSMISGGEGHTQVGDVFVVGNGTSETNRSNALRITQLGNIMGTKAFQSSGADYAEFIKPWADGNPSGEDRVGYFVTIKDGLLYKAENGDYIAGITSGNPSVVGNSDEDYYWRYERDIFNRIIMEDAPELLPLKDENGNLMFDEQTHEPIKTETGNMIKNARMKLSEQYDPSLQDTYIPRAERKEWDYVGMVGVIPVRDDGTCIPGSFCKCGQYGIATLAENREVDTFYVIERISDNVVSVHLK